MISKWHDRLSRIELEFSCDRCGYKHRGGHGNNECKCPICDDGHLRQTPQTVKRVEREWKIFKRSEDQRCSLNL